MDRITISEMAVQWRVGVGETERSKAQLLRLTIEMELDFADAAKNDDLSRTVDYFAVSQRILRWGQNREWELIERIAAEIAELILEEFSPAQVSIEVKKFILPDTGFVSARVTRRKPSLP